MKRQKQTEGQTVKDREILMGEREDRRDDRKDRKADKESSKR